MTINQEIELAMAQAWGASLEEQLATVGISLEEFAQEQEGA